MNAKVMSILLAATFVLCGFKGCSDTQVADIQAQAKKICGFEPAAESVAQMVAVAASGVAPAGVLVVSGVAPIAQAICTAVNKTGTPPASASVQALVSACPQVNGVCVIAKDGK